MNILITGATSGIGYALATHYVQMQHTVIGVGRNKEALVKLEEIGILTIELDIAQDASITFFKNKLQGMVSHIDLVILNAGVCEYVDINHFDAKLFSRVMSVNFQGVVNCLEVLLPFLLLSSKPHLVGVASMAQYLPLSRAEAYGASKAAVNYLFESLAIDLKMKNIHVSVVNPGFVKTPLTDKNDFKMPFLVDANYACQCIVKGIEKKKSEISFPLRLVIIMKILHLFPRSLWRLLGQNFK